MVFDVQRGNQQSTLAHSVQQQQRPWTEASYQTMAVENRQKKLLLLHRHCVAINKQMSAKPLFSLPTVNWSPDPIRFFTSISTRFGLIVFQADQEG